MRTTIVLGAGINGVVTAIELKKRGDKVVLVDSGPLPHPLAASTDISKAVRATYGADELYTDLADRAMAGWRDWNTIFGEELYHEIGVMFLRHDTMQPGDFEFESFQQLQKKGHKVERIRPALLRQRFPAWSAEHYVDGIFDPQGGYAESGRVVAKLIERAKADGVEVCAGAAFEKLDEGEDRVRGIVLRNRERLAADRVIATTGAWTPYVFPWTRPFLRATAHPLFHLRPKKPELFAPEWFPMFGADISSTSYYGFPIGREGVVKLGSHGGGREMSPDSPDRFVSAEEEEAMRDFLSAKFPSLADAEVVSTKLCLYSDTADGDFWIAADPEHPGLTIAAGDSGHGFKFAPVLGEIIADAADGKTSALLHKFRWRPEVKSGRAKEAARFLPNDL